jgi:hypothetical protein
MVLLITGVILYLIKWSLDSFGFQSGVFAFLFNWLLIAWVSLAGQFVPITLGRGYHRIRKFERDGRIYEQLGVRYFSRLVRRGPLTVLSPTLRFSGQVDALPRLEFETCKAEAGHMLAFLLVTLAAGYAALRGRWEAAGWLMLFNLPLNLYPVLLQRYNRARIEKIRGRMGRAFRPQAAQAPVLENSGRR